MQASRQAQCFLIYAAPCRRAVENTCLPVAPRSADGVLTYGRGLLQVRELLCFVLQSSGGECQWGVRTCSRGLLQAREHCRLVFQAEAAARGCMPLQRLHCFCKQAEPPCDFPAGKSYEMLPLLACRTGGCRLQVPAPLGGAGRACRYAPICLAKLLPVCSLVAWLPRRVAPRVCPCMLASRHRKTSGGPLCCSAAGVQFNNHPAPP